MNKTRVLVWVLAFSLLPTILAVPAIAVKKAGPVRYTLEQLDSAANLLLTVADGDRPGFCGIAPVEAKKLLMAIHPLIDEKRQAQVASLRARKPGESVSDPKWERSCARDCHCGLYAEILDSIGDERLSAADRTSRDQMMSRASSLGAQERSACAQKAKWFCKSPLLFQLRKDAKGLN